MNRNALRGCLALGLVLAGWAAGAQMVGESLRLTDAAEDDVYLWGESVAVDARVSGDVVAAGRDVTIQAPVTGDVIAAAEALTIASVVGDDLRGAGRFVDVTSHVNGHAVIAGWRVNVGEGAQVRDWLWATADEVSVSGVVAGDLRLRAATVIIDGAVGGDTEIVADRVEIRAGASFAGDLSIRSRAEAEISPRASVGGALEQQRLEGQTDPVSEDEDGSLLFWAMFLVLAVVLGVVFPRPTQRAVARYRAWPLVSVAVGFAVLAAAPVLAGLLIVTGVGVLLGLAVLFGYLLILVLGAHVALSAGADWGLHTVGRSEAGKLTRVLALVAVTIVAALVGWIPWLGPLALFLALLGGMGATAAALWQGRAGSI